MEIIRTSKFIGFTLFILLVFIWNSNFRGDTAPNSMAVADSIFAETYLSDSEGDRIDSYCFGLGGGRERSHPCVFINGFMHSGSNDKSESCYSVYYLAEANYGVTRDEVPDFRRYIPLEGAPSEVQVCGKFEIWSGAKRGNGDQISEWTFRADQYLSSLIEQDLKAKGYAW